MSRYMNCVLIFHDETFLRSRVFVGVEEALAYAEGLQVGVRLSGGEPLDSYVIPRDFTGLEQEFNGATVQKALKCAWEQGFRPPDSIHIYT